MNRRFWSIFLGLLLWGWATLVWARDFNIVGIYADEEMTTNEATAEINDLVTVYVILDRPHNPYRGGSDGEAVENVGCYSFILDFSTNLEVIDNPGLTGSTAVDKRPNCNGICVEYRNCFGGLLPVGPNLRITLKAFGLRYIGPGPGEIRLRPPTIPVVDGQMDYWYRDVEHTGWVLPMYPVTESFETPVFVVNPDALPTNKHNWGGLKSLYR